MYNVGLPSRFSLLADHLLNHRIPILLPCWLYCSSYKRFPLRSCSITATVWFIPLKLTTSILPCHRSHSVIHCHSFRTSAMYIFQKFSKQEHAIKIKTCLYACNARAFEWSQLVSMGMVFEQSKEL